MIFSALFVWLVFVIPFSISAIEITFPFLVLAGGSTHGWPWSRANRLLISGEEKKILWALLVYMAVCTASLLYTGFPATTTRGLVGKLYEYGALFAIALFAARAPAMGARCARVLWWATWLVVAHALLQEWVIARTVATTDHDPLLGHQLSYNRMVGPYKNPNDLATYLMVSGLLLLSQLFDRSNWRLSHLLLLVLVFGCLVWIQSVGAMLGLATGIGMLVLLNWKNRKRVTMLALVGILFAGSFLYLGRHSLREVLTLSDIASQDRLTMWQTALAMIQSKPLFGLGYNTFMANYNQYVVGPTVWPAYAHNCYLQITAETGLIGLAAFMVFLFYFFKSCFRAAWITRDTFLMGLFAGLIAFLVQSIFDTNLYAVRQAVLFWTLAGLAVGLSGSKLHPGPSPLR
jgi:O-antigen ligase